MPCPPIAYLASEYPAISHTFIYREVRALRAQGFTVKTASIRPPAHLDRMTPEEQAEAHATRVILATPLARLAAAHAALKLTHLRAYTRMFIAALRLVRGRRVPWLKAGAYFAEAGLLLHWMLRERVAHVHVHFANPAATVALIAASSGLVTYSLSVHGPDEFYNIEQDSMPEKVRNAVFVRCISFYCRSQVMRIAPPEQWAKIHIVRCGVDPAVYTARPDPNNTTPEILCVGRLVPAKGQHLLVEACAKLRERNIRFRLTFVGDGPDRASLESLALKRRIHGAVTFAGAVGQGQIHAFYDRADVFALPSFAEGLPVVLMEALAKGIPCVTSSITGIPELVQDGVNGFLVPASDVDGLADRLERLLEDRALRIRMGEAGRKKVETEYDVNRNCEGMGAVFAQHLRQ